jgi:hypothetical protein
LPVCFFAVFTREQGMGNTQMGMGMQPGMGGMQGGMRPSMPQQQAMGMQGFPQQQQGFGNAGGF